MFETLLILGLACVVAAIVGGGLEIAGTSIPPVDSRLRQVLLAIAGVAIIVLAFLVRPTRERPDVDEKTDVALPHACSSAIRNSEGTVSTDGGAKVLDSIKVHRGPADIALGLNSAWVAHMDGHVTRIPLGAPEPQVDPLPGVRVGSERNGQVDIAFGFQHVWVSKREPRPLRGALAKIPPSSATTDRQIDLAVPDNVATGGGAVWVTDDEAGLTRIDPNNLSQSKRKRVGVPGETRGLWAGHPPCVYVAMTDPDGFAAFDAETAKRVQGGERGVYRVGGSSEIAAGAGFLWLTDRRDKRALLRVDPESPKKATPISIGVKPYPDALAVGTSGIWTADGERTVIHIEPKSMRVEEIKLPGEPVGIAVGGDPELVWIARRKSNQVTRIRP